MQRETGTSSPPPLAGLGQNGRQPRPPAQARINPIQPERAPIPGPPNAPPMRQDPLQGEKPAQPQPGAHQPAQVPNRQAALATTPPATPVRRPILLARPKAALGGAAGPDTSRATNTAQLPSRPQANAHNIAKADPTLHSAGGFSSQDRPQ
jgi:hypothetical protein